MWTFIAQHISDVIERQYHPISMNGLQQGVVESYKLSDGSLDLFVKVAERHRRGMLEAEMDGLEKLALGRHWHSPTALCCGEVREHSYLVMTFLPLQSQNTDWAALGLALANFHQQHHQAMYGANTDNFIGTTPQVNRWHKKWSHFFAEQRIGYQLQRLKETNSLSCDIDRVVHNVKSVLKGHQPEAAPLHGDVWCGNVGFTDRGPAIYDPAFYYGDRETDIAMTELFGGFPAEFYRAYEQQWPLSDHYEFRKPLYQLYHILNHALMFGGHYLHTAQQHISTLDTSFDD